MNTYHHVCLIVDDVDAAIVEVGSALGITFHPPKTADFGGTTFPVTYSVEGPPFVELTERTDGIILDTNGFHHIGIYDETPTETRARLEAAGFELEEDGEERYGLPYRFYLAPVSGLRVELIDVPALRAAGRGFTDTPQDAPAG